MPQQNGFVFLGDCSLGGGGAYLVRPNNSGSSCNSFHRDIRVNFHPTQLSTANQIYSAKGTEMTNPVLAISSGIQLSTICFDTGIQNHSLHDEVIIYPNPATELLMISSPHGIREIAIFNLVGKKLVDHQLKSSMPKSISLDISTFESGTYFVKVQTEKGSSVQKLIIQ